MSDGVPQHFPFAAERHFGETEHIVDIRHRSARSRERRDV
jgi:hypothetical protein